MYCGVCGRYEPCEDCRRRQFTSFIRNRSAVQYSEAMKQLLAVYKYNGNERMLPLLGEMLLHPYRMHRQDLARDGDNDGFDGITYVPISEQRIRERGFNQAQRLAEWLGDKEQLPVISLLRRIRHTERQATKSRKERLMDLERAFVIDPVGLQQLARLPLARIRPLKLLLVDDVYTTGSTMLECSKTIRQQAKVDIYSLTWAR